MDYKFIMILVQYWYDMHIPVKLPWIFLGAPLIFNGAPGNIQVTDRFVCSLWNRPLICWFILLIWVLDLCINFAMSYHAVPIIQTWYAGNSSVHQMQLYYHGRQLDGCQGIRCSVSGSITSMSGIVHRVWPSAVFAKQATLWAQQWQMALEKNWWECIVQYLERK